MCLLCIEIAKNKLTWAEALTNFGEMESSLEQDHLPVVQALINKLLDKEIEEEFDRVQDVVDNFDDAENTDPGVFIDIGDDADEILWPWNINDQGE